MRLAALSALCAACASYRVLPPPPVTGELAQVPVRYEKTRFLFFTSAADDGVLDHVWSAGPSVLGTVARPQAGLFASADSGASWSFVPGAFDFHEVLASGPRLFARGATRVFRSADGGRSWAFTEVVRQGDWLDALAVAADGVVYASGRSSLYVSRDGGVSFLPMSLQLPPGTAWRARSIVPDPAHPHILYVSIRGEPQGDLLARFRALLDLSSEEALSALRLVDSQDRAPRQVAWGGAGLDGVYVTLDGGGLWKKTGLSFDAWIALHDGALYAMAAEPILQAAALVRRYPDLAGAADRQLKSGGVSPEVLREACRFPGREQLLAGPAAAALVYRSVEGGWVKEENLPLPVALALRDAAERGGRDQARALPPPHEYEDRRRQQQEQQQRGHLRAEAIQLQQGRYGGRGRQGPPSGPQVPMTPPPMRMISPDTLLAFVDPQRLLSRYGTLPLTIVSGDVASVPTEAYWNALVDALASQSKEEGEISLGPGRAAFNGAGFELLQGPAWTPLAAKLPPGYLRSMAATPGEVFVVRGDGRAWAIHR